MPSRLLIALIALSLPLGASAHRLWILPATTVLAGESPTATFDAAVSNAIFHTDYRPLPVDTVTAVGPDGETVAIDNASEGALRSSFDLTLSQPGTYRIGMQADGLSARWREDGERRMWPPRGGRYSAKGFAENVPETAEGLEIRRFSRRIETFVTAGAPDDSALAATGSGFELVALTHPNDLFAGETARFRLLYDGAPAAGAAVDVIPDGMRYRDSQQAIRATADAEGGFTIRWPRAGRYWLGAEYEDDRAEAPATLRSGSYNATFEVLPQ